MSARATWKAILTTTAVFLLGVSADVAYLWLASRNVPVWRLLPLLAIAIGATVYLILPTSWKGVLYKVGRIRRAFANGFWSAWLEVPPADVRAGRPIMLTVDCDTTRFDRKIHEVLETIMHAEQRAQRLQ